MCGIAGIVGTPPADHSVIERMCSMLGHRGPDDSGVWTSPSAHIGHTRLSILDLSDAGHQPMILGDPAEGGLVLTYNGEIYNFREVREQLPGPFRSETDTEMVLAAYREHGAECLHSFHGMFAFAIWDESRQRLFAARDRLGIKPLHYREMPGGLAFASEVEPLLELGPGAGTPDLDFSALGDYLTYGYIPTPKTAWKGVRKLGAGETMVWQDGRIEIERYWDPEPRTEVTDMEQAVGELDDLLQTIIPEHELSDVPVGVFLSGGLDSATVTAYARNPTTFTLGQPEARRDEAPAAREVARHLGTEHHERVADAPDLAAAADTIVSVFGEPFGDSAALSVWMLSRFTREQVTVALSGEGGDEMFCGYRWYGESFDRAGLIPRLTAPFLPAFSRLGRSTRRRSLTGIDRYASFLGLFSPPQVRALIGPELRAHQDPDSLWRFRQDWRPELPTHQRIQWCDLHNYLTDGMLTKVDRASMAFSLEVRPPLLDHRMVEWSFGLDAALQRDRESGRGKLVLRRLIESRLPQGHLDRPKRGFNLAIGAWAREHPNLMDRVLHRLHDAGLIRRPRFLRLTNEQTWAFLVLDRWLKRHATSYAPS